MIKKYLNCKQKIQDQKNISYKKTQIESEIRVEYLEI